MEKIGDIIQITDDTLGWFPALLIVTEPKSWGMQGCVLIPKSNQRDCSCVEAYLRLKTGQYVVVGTAAIYPSQSED